MKRFEELQEVLKYIFDSKNYKNKKVYIKSIALLAIIVIVTSAILALIVGYYRTNSSVAKKIEAHQKFVKKRQEEIKKEMDTKVLDIEQGMSPLIEAGEDMKMSTDEIMEYNRVDSQRREEKASIDQEREYNLVLDILSKKLTGKKLSPFYLEELYKDCDCYSRAQDDLFRFRSSIIAKKNLAERYKKDIDRLESFGSLDNWNKAELEKKKAYVQNADRYDPNATDKELLQILLAAPEKNNLLLDCVKRARKAIPILVKYDGGHNLILYFDKIKNTTEYFGIDIDLTVPIMVRDEEKAFSEHMRKWYEEYCKGNNMQCDMSSSYYHLYSKAHEKEAIQYIEQMNAKYEALGNNPGLDYAIFTQYRKGMHYPYHKYFNKPKEIR